MDSIISAAERADVNILNDDNSSLDEKQKMENFLRSLDPLRQELKDLDAEAFLNQSNNITQSITTDYGNENTSTTAAVSSSINSDNATTTNNSVDETSQPVKPIHNDILPHEAGIRYLQIAEKPGHYSIGIFVFPPNEKIPLHNHPGMTVLSRVLYGHLTVKTYDIIPENNNHKSWLPNFMTRRVLRTPQNSIHAYRNKENNIHSPQVLEFYPEKANLHEFTAGADGAAVLDVLVPPYDDRDCTFYEEDLDLELPNEPNTRHGQIRTHLWLVPMNQPDWFHCVAGRYGNIGSYR